MDEREIAKERACPRVTMETAIKGVDHRKARREHFENSALIGEEDDCIP